MKKKFLLLLILFHAGILAAYSQAMKAIDRDSFSLKYPDTWKIDKEDEDYDADALFSLDSKEADGASIMFMIFSMPLDPEEMLAEQLKAMTKGLIKKPAAITDFDSWGNLKGKGKMIEGKIMGIFKGKIRLFMYTDKDKSMLVLEQFYDEDVEKIGKDFTAIATSFSFK